MENCINKPGAVWWLKVINPLEEMQEITLNDVLGFAEKCTAPEVDEEEIEEFLDLEHLSAKDTPIALCRVAVEIMKDLASANPCENEKDLESTPKCEETSEKDSEKIQEIDLSESCLNDEQNQIFRTMLTRNRQSLAFSTKELGQCEIAPMRIKVDESQGIVSSQPYRYSPQKMDIIDEQVRQLIDIGVIEPSEAACCSPLVVVQKKDGKPRLCTDFRMLNMITFKVKFPMPTARSLFLYMAYKKPTIWSALNLLSGYHQCVIKEDSTPYTAFKTRIGVYHIVECPSG